MNHHPSSFSTSADSSLPAFTAAYLGRFTGLSRQHTGSHLRIYLTWCADRGLDPLQAPRADLELYVRWLQETRRFKPSTVSRRTSVVAGFYRTCLIDGIVEHSPAEHVRRPTVPPESPTLGLIHLQFEAMPTAARLSPNDNDFALVAMLGLLGLRIFEATGADVIDLREEHGHRVLRVVGKGTRIVLVPLPPAAPAPSIEPSATAAPAQSCGTGAGSVWTGTPRRAGSGGSPRPPACTCLEWTRTCSGTPSSPRCSTPASTCAMCRSPPGTPTRGRRCGTTGLAKTSTATPTTSSPPAWPRGHDPARLLGHAGALAW